MNGSGKQAFHDFLELMSFMKPRARAYTAGIIGDSLSSASIVILLSFVIQYLLNFATDRDVSQLYRAIWLVTGTFVALSIVSPFCNYAYHRCVKMTMGDIRLRVFEHMGKLPYAYVESRHSGDLLSRITNDVQTIEQTYAEHVKTLLVEVLTLVGSVIVLFALDWRFALGLIGLGALSVWINVRFAEPMRAVSFVLQERMGRFTERLTDALAGLTTMKMFALQPIVGRRALEEADRIKETAVKLGRLNGALDAANFLIQFLGFGGVLAVGILLVSQHKMELGVLAQIAQLQSGIALVFLQLGNATALMQGSFAGMSRIRELLAHPTEPERFESRGAAVLSRPAGVSGTESPTFAAESGSLQAVRNAPMLELRDVAFGYDPARPALQRVSLVLEEGRTIALVGPSGGGKSTLMKLLLGFYAPSEGNIRLCGNGIGEYTLSELRSHIAYVPQEAYLFHGTIADNLRIGKPDGTDEELRAAAQAAYAHDFITALPGGYETQVGERGASLSGGQRQRIAIARALLRNAPVLLLDEATSALDTESEQAVQRALGELMPGRTTLVIAHRLSTIEQADEIIFMAGGSVQERGTHTELLAAGGPYARLRELNEGTRPTTQPLLEIASTNR